MGEKDQYGRIAEAMKTYSVDTKYLANFRREEVWRSQGPVQDGPEGAHSKDGAQEQILELAADRVSKGKHRYRFYERPNMRCSIVLGNIKHKETVTAFCPLRK